MGLGDFGQFNAGGQVQVPQVGGNSLLMTAIFGLGFLSLVNTLATIFTPLFMGSDTPAEPETPEETARKMETMKYGFDMLMSAVEKYSGNEQ